jgi:PIN domain nuclease of toxin-antitoxin system
LDSHILVAFAQQADDRIDSRHRAVIADPRNEAWASVASIWEIGIKMRLGKLDTKVGLAGLPSFLESIGLTLLPVDHRHAVAEVDPTPATRDPFDRLLLAQCAVENMRLVTTDRVLAAHPLAWRPA